MLSDFSLQLACQHSHRLLQTVAERSVWQGLALAIPRSGRRFPTPRALWPWLHERRRSATSPLLLGGWATRCSYALSPSCSFSFFGKYSVCGVVTLSGAFGKNPQSLHRLSDCQRAAVRHARDDDAGGRQSAAARRRCCPAEAGTAKACARRAMGRRQAAATGGRRSAATRGAQAALVLAAAGDGTAPRSK